ncbi:MAG: hypothetical protein ACI4EQ_07775 [Lachnospiraceae bacterium]
MKTKKFLACLLAGTMALSLAACGGSADTSADPTTESSVVESTTPDSAANSDASAPVEASIDFEDGNMGFVAPYMVPANAAEVELSVADFNGSKALAVKNLTGKVPFIGIDATSLLGADVAKVATVEMTLGVSYEDGSFNAVSGDIFAWSGADLVETKDAWSVYLATANPKTAVATLSAGEEFVADAGNIFIVSLSTDNGVSAGKGNATLYIDNIRFLDASGNLLTADSSVAFAAPDGFENTGKDMSNLCAVTNAVEFTGFATSAGGWSQAGFTMPEEIVAALVPGAVVEIEYSSANGDMWIVMNEAAVGWSRVADNGGAYINTSKNIAQITYEQIAAVCGDDVSTWGTTMQCEASGDWEVFSVKVGQAAPVYALGNAVEFAGFECKGDAWSQNGFDMPQEIIDALVPGSVVEVTYSSENGDMWIVMPDSNAGWMRVGDGGKDVCVDGKAYITYEQIAELCSDDVSTWGARMQCEASGAWEVYGVKVGTANEMKMVNNIVNFEGFTCKGDAWSQNGFDMPQEIIDALVPGAVVSISYTSENGDMWIVMPDSNAGWMRVGDGGKAACSNGICQVTYEQIAELCGDDVSTWGARMQCEASGAWEVFSVTVGQTPVAE